MFQIVIDQMKDNLTLEGCLFSAIISKTRSALAEVDDSTTRPTTNKQVEILFKFIVVLVSGDATFLRRTSLEILNSLKLRYTSGRNTVTIKIVKSSVLAIIMSFVAITCNAVWKMSNIARRVSSLRLVTDVR